MANQFNSVLSPIGNPVRMPRPTSKPKPKPKPKPTSSTLQWSGGYLDDPYYSSGQSGYAEVMQPGQYDSRGQFVDVTPAGPTQQEIYDQAAAQQAAAQAAAEAAAEKKRMDAIRKRTMAGVDNLVSSTGIKYNNFGTEYDRTLRDWATDYISAQDKITGNQANNALNLRRGMASIAGGIRDAIRSGGVSLANMNASTSSAGEALARAFARQGNQQFNDVNNQAQLERNRLAVEQGNLDQQRQYKTKDFDIWGDSFLNDTNEGMRQQLRAYDADAQAEGVTGAVDFARRQQLYNDARARIDRIDAEFQKRLAPVRGLTQAEIDAKAAQMDVAGMEGYNPFRVNFDAGVSRGENGAVLGDLPFYTSPRSDDEYYYV